MALEELPPVLGEGAGWFMVIGFGLMFTALTMAITSYEKSALRGNSGAITSEEFATGGRNLGMGLVASDIVSQWTWAATLLMSSNMAWRVGISGSYWYAAGASVQIMLFAILAVQVKRRAPNMRTFMELVRVRWGKFAHMIFVGFALTTNTIVSAMLILGGAATLTALTGIPTWAAAFLIPIVSCLPYTLMGGLKATFLAHYFNTLFIFVSLFIFMFAGFLGGGGDTYGSPEKVIGALDATSRYSAMQAVNWGPALSGDVKTDAARYGMQGMDAFIKNAGICYKPADTLTNFGDYVQAEESGASCSYTAQAKDAWCNDRCRDQDLGVQACGSVENGCVSVTPKDHFKQDGCDQAKGEICGPSLATMASPSGLIFGIVNIVGNFGTVFVDQSYWQGAIAVKPEAAANGFILGGIVWFSVPMMMGSTHGLVGRALAGDFSQLNGASYITVDDSGAGLTPARVATVLLGDFGAWVLLIMLFMAIVSTGSAEIIAVATIMTYDVYCVYLNPELKEERSLCRMRYYAFVLGREFDATPGSTTAPKVSVDEVVGGMATKLPVGDAPKRVLQLQAKGFFKNPPTEAELSTIQQKLALRTEPDGMVTSEMVYYAIQSTILAPASSESQVVLRVMKFFCCCFAIFMGFLAVFLQVLELNLGFVYMSMGIFVGPAVVPAAAAILVKSASAKWCTWGAILGLCGGLTVWVLVAQAEKGEISLASLGGDYPFLYSNLMSILGSGAIALGGSMVDPDTTFRWEHLAAELPLVDDMPPPIEEGRSPEQLDAFLVKSYNRACYVANFLFFFLCLLLPMIFFWSGAVFGSGMFGFWIVAFMLWCFVGGLSVIILPVVEFMKEKKEANLKAYSK